MKFLSNEAFYKLQEDSTKGRDFKRSIKRLEKTIEAQHILHQDAIEDLNFNHDKTVHRLERELAKANDPKNEEAEEIEESYQSVVDKKDAEIDELLETIEEYKVALADHKDFLKRELRLKEEQEALDARERKLDTRFDEFYDERDSFRTEHKEAMAKLDDKKSGAYKEGYTDGVADTLRESQKAVDKSVDKVLSIATKVIDKGAPVPQVVMPPVAQIITTKA